MTLHQEDDLKNLKKYNIIYIVNEKRSYKSCIRLRSTSFIPNGPKKEFRTYSPLSKGATKNQKEIDTSVYYLYAPK